MSRRSYGRLCRHACTIAVLFSVIVVATAALASAQTVSGRVVDPDARPVAGAQVIVTRQNVVIVTDRTNVEGRFGPLRVTTGDYDVTASAPGMRAPAVRVTVQETRPVDMDVKLALSAVTETVVVSAAGVDTPLSRVTDSVTILDRTYLDRRQVESFPDALRIVPGLGTVTSGGRGALTSLFPRGGESDYTLVLVDGIAHNAFGGFFDAAHLGTADIDRIEVVRGPQSALFGGGAIGSVVHVITKHSGPITGTATSRRRRAGHGPCCRGDVGLSRRVAMGRGHRRVANRRRHARVRIHSAAAYPTTTTSASRDRPASAGPIAPRAGRGLTYASTTTSAVFPDRMAPILPARISVSI